MVVGGKDVNTKPILVFLHGYAAAGTLYQSLFKTLKENFVLITVDHPGMGLSSRPKGYFNTHCNYRECIDFFVESLETWRLTF